MKLVENVTLYIGIGKAGCDTLGFLADRMAKTVEAGGEASGHPAFLFVKTGKEDEGNARFPSWTVHLGRESVAGCHLVPPCAEDGRPDDSADADCWWFDPDGRPYQVPLESSLSARPEVDALNGVHLAWSSMRQVETAVEELADGTDLLDGWLPEGVRHVDVVSVFSSAAGVARGAWAFVVSGAKTALARKGIGSIRSRAVVFDASCFPGIGKSSPDRAAGMRANSLSFLSELPLWLDLAQPGCNLPSLERPDWGGGRFNRIVLADARSLFSPNRVPVDGWNLFFGIRKALSRDEFVVALLLQQESSKEHDDWTAREINNWHPVQTKVAVSFFVDDSIIRNRFALRLLQRWSSDWKDGIPSAVEAVRVGLAGRDQSPSEPFRVPELFSYGDIVVAVDLGSDEFESLFVRRCDEEKMRLERIQREFIQRVARDNPVVVKTWLQNVMPIRPGDFPLAEILERNRARWLSDWERGLPKQEEDSWGRLLECAGRKVARASVREILSDSGETRRFFVSALLGSGRRQLDARNRFANAKTDAMAWLPTGFGDSPDRAVPPNVREGVEFRMSGCPDRVDAIFAAFPEAGRDNFAQSFDALPALRNREVVALLEEAENPETGGCFVRDGEKWSSALAPVSFPFPEFVRNPAFARLRWRPWKKDSSKATLGPTPEARTEHRTDGGSKSSETDVFISYSRHNRKDVERIKKELEKSAFSCWMDLSDIPPDETNYKRRIIPAIRASRVAFLFFLSAESQASKNALKEIGFAQNRAKKHVVLVRFNDDEMTDDFFYDYQDADIIDWRKPEQKAKLLRFLEEWRPHESAPEPDLGSSHLSPDQGAFHPLQARGLSEPLPGFRRMVYFGPMGSFGLRWIPSTETLAGFWMGEAPVTQDLWTAVMGSNPSRFGGSFRASATETEIMAMKFKDAFKKGGGPLGLRPVECVSWNDCQAFLEKLNSMDEIRAARLSFRLPTEGAWERACRAGSAQRFCLLKDGTEIEEISLGRVAWFRDNSGDATHPVGLKEPNAWGLYDMFGNVCEWTQTTEWTQAVECTRVADDGWTQASDDESRVLRGGSWDSSAENCSCHRWTRLPSDRGKGGLGFRICASASTSNGE